MININKGFTLAELLAVVIIVALMASFSVGYYTKSKAQAKFAEVLNRANMEAEGKNQDAIELGMQGQAVSYSSYGPGTRGEACDASAHYCIQVATDYVTDVPRGRVACVPDDEKGQAFCETMGYGRCAPEDGHTICTRGSAAGS